MQYYFYVILILNNVLIYINFVKMIIIILTIIIIVYIYIQENEVFNIYNTQMVYSCSARAMGLALGGPSGTINNNA